MPLTPDEEYLAEHCYGYGRWEACYWFIGPEQGESNLEPGKEDEKLHARAEAFRASKEGLCDCYKFHKKINVNCWHEVISTTGRVKPQGTWKYLILILTAFKDEISNVESRAEYQRTRLGMECPKLGETCVIELAGLSSKDLRTSTEREKKRPDEDRELLDKILAGRVKNISAKIGLHNPKFVVMYGFSDESKKYWAAMAGTDLQMGIPKKVGKTVFLADRHPLYTKYDYWTLMGKKMRTEFERND